MEVGQFLSGRRGQPLVIRKLLMGMYRFKQMQRSLSLNFCHYPDQTILLADQP